MNNFPPSSNQKFGWLFSAIFVIIFLHFYLKQFTGVAIASLILAATFALMAIFAPSKLAPLNRAWFALSLFLGKIVSPIVLSMIFFVVIVPPALITRLLGRDVLLLQKRKVSSYWIEKESIDPESFKNQF